MVGNVLCLEADARGDLSRFEYIVAVQVQHCLSFSETIAQGSVHIAGRGQVVNTLNRFAVYKSGNGQLQVRTGGKGKGIAHLRYAVTLLAVEGNIPEVGIFFAMPYTDKRQT